MSRLTLAEGLCLLAAGALAVEACRPQATPTSTGDTLRDLAVAVEAVEHAHPYALAACGLVQVPEDRQACKGAVEALDDAALRGRQILATVEACRESDDAECIALALDQARELLLVLRPAATPAPSASTSTSTAP